MKRSFVSDTERCTETFKRHNTVLLPPPLLLALLQQITIIIIIKKIIIFNCGKSFSVVQMSVIAWIVGKSTCYS